MKFLADVNIAQTLIHFLRNKNHDVLDIKSIGRTISDIDIIKIAQKENRIILTHDKDFEAFVQSPKYQVGLILIRLKIQNTQHFCMRLSDLLKNKSEKLLLTSQITLEEDTITIKSYE